MNQRIIGYDFIRSFAIILVFLGHILNKETSNETVLLIVCSLSPGLTMSLLGFISGALLSSRDYDFGSFLIKRFSRIYLSLFLCLTIILFAHGLLGKKVITQHALLHFMGVSAFFDLFLVKNKATIGDGLWFISAILMMYLLLPILQRLFRHPCKLFHLLFFICVCTALNFVMYGTSSIWNVVISFSLGIYFAVNNLTVRLTYPTMKIYIPALSCIGLLIVAALSTAHVIPYFVRGLLFAFYPIVFIPLLFNISSRFSSKGVAAITFFANLSYEFYILHFYFINNRFKDFFPANTPLYGQILISFIVTLALSYGISKISAWLRKVTVNYLLMSPSDSVTLNNRFQQIAKNSGC